MSGQQQIVAIIGPTGIGKTRLSISLALALNGEVVSIDSLQVYRDGKIMTAQATAEERKGVRHHMIDYLEADEEPSHYNLGALNAIADIHRRGKVAVLCGGSTSLTEPLLFHPYVASCQPLVIVLFAQLDVIGALTDRRIDSMIHDGLLDEVKALADLQNSISDPVAGTSRSGVWKAIGFAELEPCLHGSLAAPSLQSGIDMMKQETRAYANKQLHWIWTSLLRKVYECGFEALPLRVDSVASFAHDVEENAVGYATRWLQGREWIAERAGYSTGSEREMLCEVN
jgi:adenylate isopentenyltransferase (cytokinin synthase)